jgi:hypothetical protein
VFRIVASLTGIFLLLAGLAACSLPNESRVALSDPKQSGYPGALLGHWHLSNLEGDGSVHIFVAPGGEAPSLTVDLVHHEKNKSIKLYRFTAFPSRIDGELYYNVKRLAYVADDYSKNVQPGYMIVKADLKEHDEILVLKFMMNEAVSDYFAQEKLHGYLRKVETAIDTKYLLMDVTREELLLMVEDLPEDLLFSECGWAQEPEDLLFSECGWAQDPDDLCEEDYRFHRWPPLLVQGE